MARRKGMMVGSGKRGYHNIIPKDPKVHSMSAKGMKQPQRIPFNIMKNQFWLLKYPKDTRKLIQYINDNYETIKKSDIEEGIDIESYYIETDKRMEFAIFKNKNELIKDLKLYLEVAIEDGEKDAIDSVMAYFEKKPLLKNIDIDKLNNKKLAEILYEKKGFDTVMREQGYKIISKSGSQILIKKL